MVEWLLGMAVTVLGLANVGLGMTAQIRKNKMERRCGHPRFAIVLGIVFVVTRIAFAFAQSNWFLIPQDAATLGFWAVILRQNNAYTPSDIA